MNAATNNAVELIKFAHFYNEGYRGRVLGQAPSNDKIWGLARVNGMMVSFWGRRNGVLKFKLFPKAKEFQAFEKYAEKIGGRTSGDVYTAVHGEDMRKALSPRLISDIQGYFARSLREGLIKVA